MKRFTLTALLVLFSLATYAPAQEKTETPASPPPAAEPAPAPQKPSLNLTPLQQAEAHALTVETENLQLRSELLEIKKGLLRAEVQKTNPGMNLGGQQQQRGAALPNDPRTKKFANTMPRVGAHPPVVKPQEKSGVPPPAK